MFGYYNVLSSHLHVRRRGRRCGASDTLQYARESADFLSDEDKYGEYFILFFMYYI